MSEPSSWRGQRVLVTGATGIVGSHLVRALLDEGAEPVLLIRDDDPRSEMLRSGSMARCDVVSGRLEDYDTVHRAILEGAVEAVFHLGAQALVNVALADPRSTFESNIRGTWNVLEACRARDDLVQRVVVASSDKAYGPSRSLPYTEDMPTQARHPYDLSKACADLLAQGYHATYGLPVAIARCGNVYGAGDLHWSRIVPGTIRSVLRGERPVLRSDGTYRRDYIYAKDAAAAYVDIAEGVDRAEVRGEAFNFGHEKPILALDLARIIAKRIGRPELEPDVRGGAQHEIKDQWLSSAKAAKLLGWAPRYTLEQGLDETIAWYRAHLGA